MYLFPKEGKTWHIVKQGHHAPEGYTDSYTTLCGKTYLSFLVRTTEYRDHIYPLCKTCDRNPLADAAIEGA